MPPFDQMQSVQCVLRHPFINLPESADILRRIHEDAVRNSSALQRTMQKIFLDMSRHVQYFKEIEQSFNRNTLSNFEHIRSMLYSQLRLQASAIPPALEQSIETVSMARQSLLSDISMLQLKADAVNELLGGKSSGTIQRCPHNFSNNKLTMPARHLPVTRRRPTKEYIRKVFLANAQKVCAGLVGCAGCGREMELPFMDLDHIRPRKDSGEDHIHNRILLCKPCNNYKRDSFTLTGLRKQNREKKWMHDENKAIQYQKNAFDATRLIRDDEFTFSNLESNQIFQLDEFWRRYLISPVSL